MSAMDDDPGRVPVQEHVSAMITLRATGDHADVDADADAITSALLRGRARWDGDHDMHVDGVRLHRERDNSITATDRDGRAVRFPRGHRLERLHARLMPVFS